MAVLSFVSLNQVGAGLPDNHPLRGPTRSAPLVAAALGEPVKSIPVWFMRQAGRSLPEYRATRGDGDMLEACFNTDMVTEITLQPIRRHKVDAAVLFSDIVVPLKAAGVDVTIKKGVGPVMASPVRDEADVAGIGQLGDVSAITAAIRELTAELGEIPVIGFCGAPFTLASYLIEGGPSREFAHTKAIMWSQPQLWNELLERLTQLCGQFLREQILAGVSAVQLFDSWAGALSPADYITSVLPHSRALLDSVSDLGVPRVHFGVGTGELLQYMAVPECEVVGVDQRVSLATGIQRIGSNHSVQGNLDPASFFAGATEVQRQAAQVVRAGAAARGHIFNLGHGVLPHTDPEEITRLVDWLHSQSLEDLERDTTSPCPRLGIDSIEY